MNLIEILINEKLLKDQSLIEAILYECQCALFMVDITNPNSFSQLKELTSHIESNKFPYLKKILVQNKIDLESTRQVTSNEIKEYADSNQPLDIQEISIKNSEHINELLNKINAEPIESHHYQVLKMKSQQI